MFLYFPAILFAHCSPIGGQAVIDGVMFRNGDIIGVAIRTPYGKIYSQKLPWIFIFKNFWINLPFFRGFPILLEALVNGIVAINFSAAIVNNYKVNNFKTYNLKSNPASDYNSTPKLSAKFVLSLIIAISLAIILFSITPHVLSLVLFNFNYEEVTSARFHLWDGIFKFLVFLFYLEIISFIPEVKKIFQYHGAEHKIMNNWESGFGLDYGIAGNMSRLHPRCGTTFLLFVICLSVIVQAAAIPGLLAIWTPENYFGKHLITLFYKLLLIIPISAIAYEIVHFASLLKPGFFAWILQMPGLALQKLTTREPDAEQLEVAAVALKSAFWEKPET